MISCKLCGKEFSDEDDMMALQFNNGNVKYICMECHEEIKDFYMAVVSGIPRYIMKKLKGK